MVPPPVSSGLLFSSFLSLIISPKAYWSKKEEDDRARAEGLLKDPMLRDMLPRGLERLVVGVDDDEYLGSLAALEKWVVWMDRGPRRGIRAQMQELEIRCGNIETTEAIVGDERWLRLAEECRVRELSLVLEVE